MRLTYPILPFVLIGHAAYTMLHKWAFPPAESTAASIWFSAPKGLLAPLLQQSSMDGESTCTAVWVLLGVVGLCGGETAVLNGRRGEEREREGGRERGREIEESMLGVIGRSGETESSTSAGRRRERASPFCVKTVGPVCLVCGETEGSTSNCAAVHAAFSYIVLDLTCADSCIGMCDYSRP